MYSRFSLALSRRQLAHGIHCPCLCTFTCPCPRFYAFGDGRCPCVVRYWFRVGCLRTSGARLRYSTSCPALLHCLPLATIPSCLSAPKRRLCSSVPPTSPRNGLLVSSFLPSSDPPDHVCWLTFVALSTVPTQIFPRLISLHHDSDGQERVLCQIRRSRRTHRPVHRCPPSH